MCDGISIPRACHCFPGTKLPGGLEKEEKELSPRRAPVTQDPARIPNALVDFMEEQAARQAVLPTSDDLGRLAAVN